MSYRRASGLSEQQDVPPPPLPVQHTFAANRHSVEQTETFVVFSGLNTAMANAFSHVCSDTMTSTFEPNITSTPINF